MINQAIGFIEADYGKGMEDLLADYLSLQQEAANEHTSRERLQTLANIGVDLARRVANNASAPADLLQKLANSKDATTRSHVAANPNTPSEVLLHLGREFPQQLLNNPIFALLWLENPNLIDEMPFTTLVTLLKQEQVPVFFLEQAASHLDWEVRLAVATNAQTPRTTLEALVQCTDVNLAQVAQLHVNWAGEMNEGWEEVANQVILFTVLHPTNLKYIKELAKISLIPEFILDRVPETWCGDKFLEVVASNANNFPHILEALARNNKWEFRRAVASNPNTPISLLHQLAMDDDLMVRAAVASNPNTPASLLHRLAVDNYGTVRREVAKNPNTPTSLLEQLTRDKHNLVCRDATKMLAITANHLELLAQNQDSKVREHVAQNPNTSDYLLELLAKDKAVDVRCSVAQNPKISKELLKQLLSDRTWKVCLVAMRTYSSQNPEALPALLEYQLTRQSQTLNLGWDNCFIDSTTSLIRLIMLLHPQVSGKALAENSRSLAWLERYAIAQHPNTPPDTLHILVKDGNRIVRAAAKANLQNQNQT
jgi:hypothetical protein